MIKNYIEQIDQNTVSKYVTFFYLKDDPKSKDLDNAKQLTSIITDKIVNTHKDHQEACKKCLDKILETPEKEFLEVLNDLKEKNAIKANNLEKQLNRVSKFENTAEKITFELEKLKKIAKFKNPDKYNKQSKILNDLIGQYNSIQ